MTDTQNSAGTPVRYRAQQLLAAQYERDDHKRAESILIGSRDKRAVDALETAFARITELEAAIDLIIPDDCKFQLHADATNLVKLQSRVAELEAHIAAEPERMREVVKRCAKVADDLARAEDRALRYAETPQDRGRCAVIAAEFRRAAKAIRAQEIKP